MRLSVVQKSKSGVINFIFSITYLNMMHKLETSQQGRDDALIERMQLDLAYKRVKAYATGLAIAVLLVAALWSEVAHEILLTWLVAVSLIMSVRYVYAQRYMRMEHSTSIKLEKWRAVFLVGAAVSGAGSAIVVFCFFSFQLDPVTLLLVLNAVGLAGFTALSLARVSSVAVAFQVAALLPLSIWLFSTGEHIHYLMGLNVLLYLGLMLFLSRTTHQLKLSLSSTTKQGSTLLQQEVKQRMPRFSESAHGFFYSATHYPDEYTSMPFFSITTRVSASGIDDELGLRSEDVPDGIEPILAFIHPDDIDRYVEARDASQLTLSPLCLELRINHPIKGERWVELKSLP